MKLCHIIVSGSGFLRHCIFTGKPSAPSGRLRAKKSGDSVLLDWNAPYDDGGSRITSYVVEYKDVDSVVWQRAAVLDGYTRSVAVHGLRDAAIGDYLFRVTAVNEMGSSEPLETDVTVRPSRPTAGLYTQVEGQPPPLPGQNPLGRKPLFATVGQDITWREFF